MKNFCQKRVLYFLIALVLISPSALKAAAAELPPQKGPMMKLYRGLANVLSAPAEYMVQYATLERTQSPMVAFAGGTLYGTLFTFARYATGAYEILTFPFPIPADYDPIMHPDTAIQGYEEIINKPPKE